MNTPHDLYARILCFPIDEGTPDLSFEARIARENAWSITFARRVVFEYRRFVFLAMTAGHQVTPSDQVDQAWHLHLTYSRSYWDRLCGELLDRPLHHGPTRGGAAESARFDQQYERTLAAYRAAFGEEPPADIWPPAAARFGEDLHFVRVNTARNWVVPKGAVKRAAIISGIGMAAAVCATGCEGVVNPFALRGTDFLGFFIPLLLAAFVLSLLARSQVRGPGPEPGDDEPELDWADAAYLAGREHRLTVAAVARLAAGGRIRVSSDGLMLVPQGIPPSGRSAVEVAVYESLPVSRNDRSALNALARRVDRAFAERAAELQDAGYLMPNWRAFFGAVFAAAPLASVAFFIGLPRLMHAAENQHLRGYLGTTMIVAAGVCLLLFAFGLYRLTRRGAYALKRMRYATDRTSTASDPDTVGQSVALYGTTALAACGAAELTALATWYPHPTSGAGNGGGCGTGCGSGDGGGGGGGGGCGGGGCGGCGGCGG